MPWPEHLAPRRRGGGRRWASWRRCSPCSCWCWRSRGAGPRPRCSGKLPLSVFAVYVLSFSVSFSTLCIHHSMLQSTAAAGVCSLLITGHLFWGAPSAICCLVPALLSTGCTCCRVPEHTSRIGAQQAANKLPAPKRRCSQHWIRAHFCVPTWRRPRCRALNRQQLRGQAAAACDAPADDDYEAALDDREVSPEVVAHLRSVRENLGKAVRGALAAPLRPDRSARVQA